ncbi:MAG: cytochrome c biogenesis protein ResB [Deltaproteobacteria bacterium]|nr:cytochrome c biogenesis protein ResB [Deltaproteobacteria bacterium]
MSPLSERIKNHIKELKGTLPEETGRYYRWAYKKLSSINTSIYIIGLMALFFIIGTIFPQGESLDEYAKAGGGFLPIIYAFDLLDFFTSPVFLLLSFVLLLNLSVCTYERYPSVFDRRLPEKFEPNGAIPLHCTVSNAHEEVKKAFKSLGFRIASKDSSWIVMEKGLPYKVLTWLYHAGIIACFFGFTLTWLFAFEDTMKLKPHDPQTVTPETAGRLARLWKDKADPTEFHLLLDQFQTEYVESPRLEYPKDKLSRLAIGLGWKNLAYEMKDDSLSVTDWRAKIKVIKGSRTLAEKLVEINDPIKYGGYTFYLIDFEQNFRLRVDDNPILLETENDEELMIPGVDLPLKFGTFRTGTLKKLDGTIEAIRPYTVVKHPSRSKDVKKDEEIGRLEVGGSLYIDGTRVTLTDVIESPIISFRYDPGVPVLWYAGIFVLATMSLRFFGLYYMAAYNIDEKDGVVVLEVCLKAKGLSADRNRVLERLKYHLSK